MELFRRQYEQLLLLMLASVLSRNVREAPRSVRVHARTLRRAIEYIAHTPPEEFSFDHLARHAGASLRSIQMAFRAEFDSTVRDWVRNYWLDRARDMLQGAQFGQSVTEIALECGFTHTGRFSSAYFQRFGEYPYGTLTTARGSR